MLLYFPIYKNALLKEVCYLMRNLVVFILVALFVLGGLMLVGCKKKEAPTAETVETAAVTPETVAPATPETVGTAEVPTAEGAPGEGGK